MLMIANATEMEAILNYCMLQETTSTQKYGGMTIKGIVMPKKDIAWHMYLEVVIMHLLIQQ